jgi:hypothetical protein
MLNGSFFPLSVTPGTLTFRFVKYFSSILYGCRAPDVSSNVITRTGPASVATTGVGFLSMEGPIATESSRVMAGAEARSVAFEEDAAGAGLDDDKGLLEVSVLDKALFDGSAGCVFSLAIAEVLVVAGKSEVMGEVVGIETSLSNPDDVPSFLLESISLISTGILGCGVDEMAPWPVDCVDDAIGRLVLGSEMYAGISSGEL